MFGHWDSVDRGTAAGSARITTSCWCGSAIQTPNRTGSARITGGCRRVAGSARALRYRSFRFRPPVAGSRAKADPGRTAGRGCGWRVALGRVSDDLVEPGPRSRAPRQWRNGRARIMPAPTRHRRTRPGTSLTGRQGTAAAVKVASAASSPLPFPYHEAPRRSWRLCRSVTSVKANRLPRQPSFLGGGWLWWWAVGGGGGGAEWTTGPVLGFHAAPGPLGPTWATAPGRPASGPRGDGGRTGPHGGPDDAR